MFNVNLTMSREELEACLKASREAEVIAKDWLAQIRTNIRALELAVSPIRCQTVKSETEMDVTYIVTRTQLDTGWYYECNCPAFQYKRGIDMNGNCKHIRTARLNPSGWA